MSLPDSPNATRRSFSRPSWSRCSQSNGSTFTAKVIDESANVRQSNTPDSRYLIAKVRKLAREIRILGGERRLVEEALQTL